MPTGNPNGKAKKSYRDSWGARAGVPKESWMEVMEDVAVQERRLSERSVSTSTPATITAPSQ